MVDYSSERADHAPGDLAALAELQAELYQAPVEN